LKGNEGNRNTIKREPLNRSHCVLAQHVVPCDIAANAQDVRVSRNRFRGERGVTERRDVAAFWLLYVGRCGDCELGLIRPGVK
jgi:hypothetical protein